MGLLDGNFMIRPFTMREERRLFMLTFLRILRLYKEHSLGITEKLKYKLLNKSVREYLEINFVTDNYVSSKHIDDNFLKK